MANKKFDTPEEEIEVIDHEVVLCPKGESCDDDDCCNPPPGRKAKLDRKKS